MASPIVVMGVSGSGKSTVGAALAQRLRVPFADADDFHPPANIEKMTAGTPLNDDDRYPWLEAIGEWLAARCRDGGVMSCSALKRKYRDVIRVAPYFTPNLYLHFIYLDAPEEVLLQRVTARQNHYMGASMVHSQFDILERPKADEVDVLTVDVTRPAEAVMADALGRVLDTMENIRLNAQ